MERPQDFSHRLRNQAFRLIKALRGSGFQAHLETLSQMQWLSWEENRRIQQELLGRFLTHAAQRIPFYRDRFEAAGVTRDGSLTHWDALANLPPLTRQDVQAYFSEPAMYLDPSIPELVPPSSRVHRLTTSGTTGTVSHVYLEEDGWEWYKANTWFYFQWMGLSMGMPYLFFWGTPRDFYPARRGLSNWIWMDVIQNRHILDCRYLSEATMFQHLQSINRMVDHQHLVAYTHELYDLACFSLAQNIPVTRPFQGIMVTTARLTETMRETLQQVFHGPVLSRYGSREVGDVACECPYQKGFHIHPFYTYLEVVDEAGYPVPPGEEGRILVTNLRNPLMPLIRYEIGDTGVLNEPQSCACGRAWPTLAAITGRVYERLVLPDGATIGNVFLNYALEELVDVQHYQLHKLAPDWLEIRIVAPELDYAKAYPHALEHVQSRLENLTNRQMRVTFRQVEAMDKAPSGKQPIFVSHVPDKPLNYLLPATK